MSAIDNRIVQLGFDNSQFGRNVDQTMKQLDALKKSLTMENAQKGLAQVQKTARGINLNPISASANAVAGSFTAMGVAGVTAIATITHAAITQGAQIAKSFTIAPVSEGFADYNTKLTSVRTIMNATGEDMATVNGYFKELDTYADKTVFNLSDMTSAFAKFTNAGVEMKDSVPAIKGIANMVAYAGQGANEASIAMYNLSQSIAGGFLTTTDYKSLNLANVATKEWKDNMIAAAVEAGKLKKSADGTYSIAGDKAKKAYTGQALFNEALAEGWLESKTLLKVLGEYGDPMSKIGKKAQAAAQDVKSLPMMMETLKASVATGWTDSFELILGNVDESTKMFTSFTGSIQKFLDKSTDSRNAILEQWKAFGGRDVAIRGIKLLFKSLGTILKPIKDAFRDIFPPKTAADLFRLTQGFSNFAYKLRIGEETANNLRRSFRGLFAIFSIVGQLISGVIAFFKKLFGQFSKGSGDLGKFTGGVGDFLVKLDGSLKKGEVFIGFFETLANVISMPIVLLQKLAGAISTIFPSERKIDKYFEGIDDSSHELETLNNALNATGNVMDKITGIWDNFKASIGNTDTFVGKVVDTIATAIENIWPGLSSSIKSGNFDAFMQSLQTAFLGGIAIMLRKLVKSKFTVDATGGFLETLKQNLDNLTGGLKAMQLQVKAKVIFTIAAAVALLAGSMLLLSAIKPERLATAIGGLTAAMSQLLAGMAILVLVTKHAGFVKIPIMAGTLVLLASAIVLLAIAAKTLSSLSWEELAKGLGGVMVLFGSLALMMLFLTKNRTDLIGVAVGIRALAGGIILMATAVKILAALSWEELAKGLTGIAGGLVAIAFTMKVIGRSLKSRDGYALILLAVGLNLLAVSMKIFATMDWEEMAKGLTAVAGLLTIIAITMRAMPLTMVASAAALVLVGFALNEMAVALNLMSKMSWEEIGKSMTVLAGTMVILAGTLTLMQASLGGAAALLVVSASLAVLTPILVTLGLIPYSNIAKALITIAAAIGVLALSSYLVGPLMAGMMALAGTMFTLGSGLFLAGAGMLAFASGFAILGTTGVAGAIALTAIVKAIAQILPEVFRNIGFALVELFKAIAEATPQLKEALWRLLDLVVDTVMRYIPKIGKAISLIITEIVRVLVDAAPQIAEGAISILISFLTAIKNNIYRVTTLVIDIIKEFIRALKDGIPDFIKGGIDFIVSTLNTLADQIRTRAGEIGGAIGNLVSAMIDLGKQLIKGLGQGLLDALPDVKGTIKNVAGEVVGFFEKPWEVFSPSRVFKRIGKNLMEGLVIGVVGSKADVKESFDKINQSIKDQMDKLKDDIQKDKDKLKDLYAIVKPTKADKKAIASAEKSLRENTKLYKDLSDANELFNKKMKKQKSELLSLGSQYEKVVDKLAAARDELKAAKDAYYDFKDSTTDAFDDLPAIEKTEEHTTSLDEYFDTIRKTTEANKQYRKSLDILRDMGLDEMTYRKFLEEGTVDQFFLDELIAAGPAAVKELTNIDKALSDSAKGIGYDAAEELYRAGVNSAKGIVKGLEDEMANITKKMESIGEAMARAIKKELGIKSPSQVFMEIAQFMMLGLADGLKDTANVEAAIEDAGVVSIDKMRKTIEKLRDAVDAEVDIQPTIAPVLDLDAFRKDASRINGYLKPDAISANTSRLNASSVADDIRRGNEEDAAFEAVSGDSFAFTQNNYSPTALSSGEIYRQTKNQLSVAKGAIDK